MGEDPMTVDERQTFQSVARIVVDPNPDDRAKAHGLVGTGVPEMLTEPNVVAPALVTDRNGEPLLLALRYSATDLASVRQGFLRYPMDTTVRAVGIRNRSRVFGYGARRVVMQRNGCRACSGADEAPEAHAQIVGAVHALQTLLREALPTVADRDETASQVVLPDWRMGGTQWTSGVLNKSSPLPYHYDRNNLEPIWSAMICVRRGVRGGFLHVPELGLVVECRDGDVIYFPGWHFVHGVTPLHLRTRDAYRYTAVYYCVREMRDCLPSADEIVWARQDRTARESDTRSHAERLGKRRPTETRDPDWKALNDLVEFARIETESRDVEPWADLLRAAATIGGWESERTLWMVRHYNSFDSLGAGFEMARRWPTPDDWAEANPTTKATISELPCTQERRGLRGGKQVRVYDSYVSLLGGRPQSEWIAAGGVNLRPLVAHLRQVWGVGRQTAFEWAEFLFKVSGVPVVISDAMLWESEGPRRCLERLFRNPNPTESWLDERVNETRAYLADRGVDVSLWDLETLICDFNVMRDGRYYPGRHLAALREEIASITDSTDREVMEEAWRTIVPAKWRSIKPGIDASLLPVYRNTGKIVIPV